MSERDERREAESTALAAMIEHTRQTIATLERLRKAGLTSFELEQAEAHAAILDMFLKKHGHAGRLAS